MICKIYRIKKMVFILLILKILLILLNGLSYKVLDRLFEVLCGNVGQIANLSSAN